MLIYFFILLLVFLFNWYVCNADARIDPLAQTHIHTHTHRLVKDDCHRISSVFVIAISEFLYELNEAPRIGAYEAQLKQLYILNCRNNACIHFIPLLLSVQKDFICTDM